MAHAKSRRGGGIVASWVILSALLWAGLARADTTDAAAPDALPGHLLNLEKTVQHCQEALVATLEKVTDVLEPTASPTLNYGTLWKVTTVLRGEYAPETTLILRVRYGSKDDKEALPKVASSYVLIGYGPAINPNEIAIVLENTTRNRDKIKTLLQKEAP